MTEQNSRNPYYLPILYVVLAFGALFFALKHAQTLKLQTYAPPDWSHEYTAPHIFTKEEIATKYNGKNGNPSLLTIMGEVFDVTGSKYYEQGRGYSVFVGRDATLAFVNGDFNQNSSSDDISSLNHEGLKSIQTWVEFYR